MRLVASLDKLHLNFALAQLLFQPRCGEQPEFLASERGEPYLVFYNNSHLPQSFLVVRSILSEHSYQPLSTGFWVYELEVPHLRIEPLRTEHKEKQHELVAYISEELLPEVAL